MKKMIGFGEIMLRLTPEQYLRFDQADKLCASYGGGEANVCVCLANLGINSSFLTALPDNAIAKKAMKMLRFHNVDTKHIISKPGRLGIYFLEKGASQRPSQVIYDRAYSAISLCDRQDFDFYSILKGYSHIHITGITPALSHKMANATLECVKVAKELGLVVSFDLNYRKKLWTQKEANNCLSKICRYVDVLIANEQDASDVFGISGKSSDVESGVLDHDDYVEICKKLKKKFPNLNKIAITLRQSINANINKWSAMLYADSKAYFSKVYDVHIVDRVGGGDSFAAGLIYGLMNDYNNQDMIEFSVACSCLKHTIEEDFNLVNLEEVLSLKNGNGSGRVNR